MRAVLWGAVVAVLVCVVASPAAPATDRLAPAGGWTWQNPLPQGNDLYDACMVDVDHGWVVGAGGALLATTDGGATWLPQDTGLDTAGSVFFLDDQHGWVSGEEQYVRWGSYATRHVVLATVDGGATWTRQDLGSDAEDEDLAVTFVDVQYGWAVGNLSRDTGDGYEYAPVVLATTDGGATWSAQDLTPPDNVMITCGTFIDRDHGWVVGAAPGGKDGWPRSVLFTTTDGGATWSPGDLAADSGPEYLDIAFVDADHGWAVGVDQRRRTSASILATSDGGATWHEQLSDLDGSFALHSVAFVDADRGWAVGSQWGTGDPDGVVVATSDGGATWKAQTAGSDKQVALGSVAAGDATHCVAVGMAGTILSTADGGSTWREYGSASPGRRTRLVSVSCTGPDQAWAVGSPSWYADTAVVVGTSNGGATWSVRDPGIDVGRLFSVDFADQQHGWAAGSGGTIIATADGGTSWRRQSAGGAHHRVFWSVAFADAAHGWVVGDGGYVASTRDGGAHWRRQVSGTNVDLDSVATADARHAWALGTRYHPDGSYAGRLLLRTSDGGASWVRPRPRARLSPSAVSFVTQRTGWAVADRGAILLSTDGGAHWVTQRRGSGTASLLTSIFFLDREHGWAWGVGATVFATVDGGWHWSRQDLGTDALLSVRSLTFADAERGWAVGAQGMIVATTNGGRPATPDPIPPATTARATRPRGYHLGGWSNRPITVAFKAVDDVAGWGVARTEYKVDGALEFESGVQAHVPAPADHSADGAHTITFHSVDLAGNAEAPQVCTVSIDTRRPRVLAPVAARVVRGATASLGYRVVDRAPCAGTARVRIRVCDASGRLVMRLGYHDVPVNAAQSATFTCDLPRGRYNFSVTASDAAGNLPLAPAGNVLVVR